MSTQSKTASQSFGGCLASVLRPISNAIGWFFGNFWMIVLPRVTILIIVALVGVASYQRFEIIRTDYDSDLPEIPVTITDVDDPATEATEGVVDAASILERAEDTLDSIDLLLNFVEAASVILAVSLAAAALAGIRGFDRLSTELQNKLDAIEKATKLVEDQRENLENAGNIREIMDRKLQNVNLLMLANQELQMHNYQAAMKFADEALRASKEMGDAEIDNPLALYISGWLSLHYGENGIEPGFERLALLHNLSHGGDNRRAVIWQSAYAAYGVALRRKAKATYKVNRIDNLRPASNTFIRESTKAVTVLRSALVEDEFLLDPSAESYWGPVGGVMQDIARAYEALDTTENPEENDAARDAYREAIVAYDRSLKVTPRSSYPQGNKATLLLRELKLENTLEKRDEVIEAFRLTRIYAIAELAVKPFDYYPTMDVAMACTILGYVAEHIPDFEPMRDEPGDLNFGNEAQAYFKDAINAEPGKQTLEVSRVGWRRLYEYLPTDATWDAVRADIIRFHDRMADMLDEPTIAGAETDG